jgi:hypothetical protein
MADIEKADALTAKEQMPRPIPATAGPIHSGAGLESPRSRHC